MPIRHARHSDIPIMARVVASSFGPDKLFQVLFPQLDEYPEDFVTFWRRSLRASWWGYSDVLMVSYDVVTLDASDLDAEEQALATTRNNQIEILTGVSAWSRVGLGWERYWGVWGWWDPRCLIQKLVQLRNKLVYFFRPCRAAARPTADDPEPLLFSNFMARTWRWMQPLTEFPMKPWRKNYWMLDVLAIHPRWQGKGCGKALGQWGVMQARSDRTGNGKGVPAMVVSAAGKEPFYKKCGFDELVGFMTRDVDEIPEANPMGSRGIPGGAVIWSSTWDDENAQIQVLKSSTVALDKQ